MVQVVAALIWDNDRFLACQRPAHKARGLMWEFVGGKVEPGESREKALCRECREELDIEITVKNVYFEVDHVYPDISIHLSIFNAQIQNGTPKLLEHADLRWILPEEIAQYTFCPADTEILEKICDDTKRLFELRHKLSKIADPKYKQFHASLMPTFAQERILGVRMPALRKIANDLKQDCAWFLSCMPTRYYEELNLYGLFINQCKDFDRTVFFLEQFLPFVDNWATCDLITPEAFRDHPQMACQQALIWLRSAHPYTVRFAIGVLMRFGMQPEAFCQYADLVCELNSDHYYVKMMIAWYFATALSSNFEHAVSYLEQNKLPLWIHNKTIQKGIESYRITQEQKAYLRKLRR